MERRNALAPPQAERGERPLEERGYAVTITCYRRRLIDPDNLCVKFAIDAIKGYAIPDDSPRFIKSLNIRQEKAKEPRTVIEVTEL